MTTTYTPTNYSSKLMNPQFLNHKGERMPNTGDWQGRHVKALTSYSISTPAWCIVQMLKGWATYADSHSARYESGIGEDGVLGDQWHDMGRAILGLLDGETGNLDCGTLNSFILDTLKAEGFGDEA